MKSLLIDMRENAMKVMTWMRCAVPNPEDMSEIWLNTISMTSMVVKWATEQLDLTAAYHSVRTANVIQVHYSCQLAYKIRLTSSSPKACDQ